MIIIDASIVRRAFSNPVLIAKILSIVRPIRAPEKLTREILNFKTPIMRRAGASHAEFDSIWAILLSKIVIEKTTREERLRAKDIIKTLKLDKKDLDYIALCCRYSELKPTFWTRDSPFVKGEKARKLRDEYGIYGNFNVS